MKSETPSYPGPMWPKNPRPVDPKPAPYYGRGVR